MTDQPKETPAVTIGVTPEGASAQVSEGALAKVGQAAAWLFPKKNAKAKITAAVADRVADKIRSGAPLDEDERNVVSRLFRREARALANSEQVAEAVHAVLPETSERMAALPPDPDRPVPSEEFIRRAESVASDIGEEDIRDLFSRVIAGEISRPGSFSLKTLEAVRHLDPEIAKEFRAFCNYIVESSYVIDTGVAETYLSSKGFGAGLQFEFEDAGLVASGSTLSLEPGKTLELKYGEQRVRFTWDSPGRKGIVREYEWISLIRLTRTGYELALALPFSPDALYFDAIVKMGKDLLKERGTTMWTNASDDSSWTPA